MICSIAVLPLLALRAMVFVQDPETPLSAEKELEFEISQSAPLFEALWPSKQLIYRPDFHGVLYIKGVSDDFPLGFKVQDSNGVFLRNEGQAAIRTSIHIVRVKPENPIRIIACSKSPSGWGKFRITLERAQDSEQTRSIAKKATSQLQEWIARTDERVGKDWQDDLNRLLDEILLVPGALESPTVHNAIVRIETAAKAYGVVRAVRRAREARWDYCRRFVPRDHYYAISRSILLADSLLLSGEYEKATQLMEEQVGFFSQNFPDEANALGMLLNCLGLTYLNSGQLSTARDLFEAVLALASKSRYLNPLEKCKARYGLARVQYSLVDMASAMESCKQVLAAIPFGNDDRTRELILNTKKIMIAIYLHRGCVEEASRMMEDLADGIDNSQYVNWENPMGGRLMMALILEQQGEFERALEKKLEILQTLRDMGVEGTNAASEVSILFEIAITYDELGDFNAALHYIDQALSKSRQSAAIDRNALLMSAYKLYFLVRAEEIELLQPACWSFLKIMRRFLAEGTTELSPREAELLVSLTDPLLSITLTLSSSEVSLLRGKEWNRECLSLIESARGIAFWNQDNGGRMQADPKGELLRLQRRELTIEIERLYRENQHDEELNRLIRKRDALDREEAKLRAEGDEAKSEAQNLDLADVVSKLGVEDAVVTYWVYDHLNFETYQNEERLLAFVLRQDETLTRHELGKVSDIHDSVVAWRALLDKKDSGTTWRQEMDRQGSFLRQKLFDPLAEDLSGVEKLVVCLDGPLHWIPLDALPYRDGIVGDHFVFEHHINLASVVRELPDLEDRPIGLLAFAGIDYDRAPLDSETLNRERSLRAEYGSLESLQRGADRSDFVEILRNRANGDPYGFLPESMNEVHSLKAIFDESTGGVVRLLSGIEASRKAFISEASRARFIHLATHGYIAEKLQTEDSTPRLLNMRTRERGIVPSLDRALQMAPMTLSGLTFAGANLPPNENGVIEGILVAAELSYIDLNQCEMIVLSACSTHVGPVLNGQGVYSLQKALHKAGAHSVVANLWPVGDVAAAHFMKEFYLRVLTRGMPKAQALREAKQVLRRSRKPDGAPQYGLQDWAGWILTGNSG